MQGKINTTQHFHCQEFSRSKIAYRCNHLRAASILPTCRLEKYYEHKMWWGDYFFVIEHYRYAI